MSEKPLAEQRRRLEKAVFSMRYLFLHLYLTDAERRAVERRIDKDARRYGLALKRNRV